MEIARIKKMATNGSFATCCQSRSFYYISVCLILQICFSKRFVNCWCMRIDVPISLWPNHVKKFFNPASLASWIARSISCFVRLRLNSGNSVARHAGRYWNSRLTRVSFPRFLAIHAKIGFVQHSRCPGRMSMRMIRSPFFLASRWFLVQTLQYSGASLILWEQSPGPYLKSRR